MSHQNIRHAISNSKQILQHRFPPGFIWSGAHPAVLHFPLQLHLTHQRYQSFWLWRAAQLWPGWIRARVRASPANSAAAADTHRPGVTNPAPGVPVGRRRDWFLASLSQPTPPTHHHHSSRWWRLILQWATPTLNSSSFEEFICQFSLDERWAVLSGIVEWAVNRDGTTDTRRNGMDSSLLPQQHLLGKHISSD